MSIPITRLVARNYGPSEYSPKIRVIGSILSAVTSVARINMQCAVQCMVVGRQYRVHIPVGLRYCTSATTEYAEACVGHSQRTVLAECV